MSISAITPANSNSVFKQSFKQNPVVQHPVVNPTPQPAEPAKSNKTLPIVASAVALTSLGVAGMAVAKNRGNVKAIGELKGTIETLTQSLERKTTSIEENVKGLGDTINTVKSGAESAVNEVRGAVNDVRNSLGHETGALKGEIAGIRDAVVNPQKAILTRPVEINGKTMELGSVMHGYGQEEAKLTEQLRSESTRRILGAVKPITLPDNAMIRVPTAEFTGFAKTGGLAVVPRELIANLGAVVNNKQKAELIVDTPMYLGQVENTNFFRIARRPDGKFDYISKKGGKDTRMATMQKIDEMHVPITTDKGRSVERVEVFMTDEMRQAVDLQDTLAQFEPETAKAIKESLEQGNNFSTPLVEFTAGLNGQPHKAEVKFRTVFYKNDKFRMDGPVQEGKVKNIYNDQTTAAGETERNIYFCKYMYENLISSAESSEKPLKADWIIGNDWHTGALSAMTRLLTPARKAMGMEPEAAEKLYNTPITTLMHNFKLQGSAYHSQDKMLNIMFGEHAAKVAENAWMPQKADMPGHLMNGLFAGDGINPQTMAMAYADDIVFVSKGNFNEMATVREFGGTNYALASMRGRTWQYGDRAKLEEIAMASGIRPNEIGEFATAKGITNGCDRVNNMITSAKARKLEKDLNLPAGSLISEEKAILDPFAAHQNNKKVGLQRVVEDVATARTSGGKENPLKIRDFEHTDLTGVDENTMVFGMAGRIVDQKGIDNWAEGTLRFYERGNYDKANPPVNYLQGIGDESYIGKFMEVKGKVREIDPKAADRMVFAGVFSEPGRYDCCKMISDFDAMPSWDEPCGLVHKEIGYASGAISIVNKRGGLTDGLTPYVKGQDNASANSIFVDFMDKETHSYEDAISHNGQKIADAMETAQEWFNDKKSLAQGVKNSYTARFDWLRGKVQEYVEIGKRHGVINDTVDSKY